MDNDTKDLDKKLIQDHDYDGIQELDNPLPRWWLLTFYASIVFSIVYYGYYEFGGGPTTADELKADMEAFKSIQKKEAAAQPSAAEVDFKAMIADEAAMQRARAHFAGKCSACHGQSGQGIIGPNLTDKHWIHDKGSFTGIVKVIKEGVLAKGMPPHSGMIAEKEILELSAYVISLVGTNPENAKAAEGELVE